MKYNDEKIQEDIEWYLDKLCEKYNIYIEYRWNYKNEGDDLNE